MLRWGRWIRLVLIGTLVAAAIILPSWIRRSAYPPIRRVSLNDVPVGMAEDDVESLLGGPPNVPRGFGDFWIRNERREDMHTVKAWEGFWVSRTKGTSRRVIVAFTADGRVAKAWIQDSCWSRVPPWRMTWINSGANPPKPTPNLLDRCRDWLDW
jgi:hypothetical protein